MKKSSTIIISNQLITNNKNYQAQNKSEVSNYWSDKKEYDSYDEKQSNKSNKLNNTNDNKISNNNDSKIKFYSKQREHSSTDLEWRMLNISEIWGKPRLTK